MNPEPNDKNGPVRESQLQGSSLAASRQRLVWVDAARGVAILWIMGVHFISIWGPPPQFTAYLREFISPHMGLNERLANLLMAGLRLGWQGVDIFVVLSGFVLTLSYLSETRHRPYVSWLARRAVRIYPMYWAAIICTIAMFGWSFRRMSFDWSLIPSRFDIVTHALGLHILWKSTFFSICAAWWFIGLILQLYLAFPIMVRALVKIGNGRFLFGVTAFFLLTRLAMPQLLAGAEAIEIRGFFGYYALQFGVGMVLARVWAGDGAGTLVARIAEHRALLGGLYVVWILAKCFGLGAFLPVPLATTAIALICINALRRLEGSVLVAALARIGTYSYELYLIHAPLQTRIMGPSSQQSFAEASGRLTLHILALCIGAFVLKRWGTFASSRLLSIARRKEVPDRVASQAGLGGDGATPGSEPSYQYPKP